jgi:sugar phosphate isomerase/epimerase
MASCGHDPVDAVHKLASYLKMVHLKDVAAVGAENNVLLGTGICKIPEVMKALKQINYRGLVAIEYEYDGDSSADMRTQVAYARKLA